MSRSSGVLFRGEMFLWTCEIQVDSWCLTPEKYLHLQEKARCRCNSQEFSPSPALFKHQPHAGSLALRKHQPHASPQNCAGNNKKHKKQSAL